MIRDELARLVERKHLTIAVAESVTGGELASALVDIPGSGEWFKGGVVAYDSAVKHDLLGVEIGPMISASAAVQMADGVARLMDADVGIATTGCSGPEPMEDQPVGTLWVGVAIWDHCTSTHHLLAGEPEAIRASSIPLAIAATAGSIVDAWVAKRSASA